MPYSPQTLLPISDGAIDPAWLNLDGSPLSPNAWSQLADSSDATGIEIAADISDRPFSVRMGGVSLSSTIAGLTVTIRVSLAPGATETPNIFIQPVDDTGALSTAVDLGSLWSSDQNYVNVVASFPSLLITQANLNANFRIKAWITPGLGINDVVRFSSVRAVVNQVSQSNMAEKIPQIRSGAGENWYFVFFLNGPRRAWRRDTHVLENFSDTNSAAYKNAMSEVTPCVYQPATWPLTTMPTDGTYEVQIVKGAGTSFNADLIAMNGGVQPDDHFVISGGNGVPDSEAVIATLGGGGGSPVITVSATGRVYSGSGTAIAGVVVSFRCAKPPSGSNVVAVSSAVFSATSGSDGTVSVTLILGATYTIQAGAGAAIGWLCNSTQLPAMIAA